MEGDSVGDLMGRAKELEEQKNGAYKERDRLLSALSYYFPAHLQRHPDEDTEWEADWRWIVVLRLPTGQATWHIHDSELALFDHLRRDMETPWDGHSTDEKYERLEAARGAGWRQI